MLHLLRLYRVLVPCCLCWLGADLGLRSDVVSDLGLQAQRSSSTKGAISGATGSCWSGRCRRRAGEVRRTPTLRATATRSTATPRTAAAAGRTASPPAPQAASTTLAMTCTPGFTTQLSLSLSLSHACSNSQTRGRNDPTPNATARSGHICFGPFLNYAAALCRHALWPILYLAAMLVRCGFWLAINPPFCDAFISIYFNLFQD